MGFPIPSDLFSPATILGAISVLVAAVAFIQSYRANRFQRRLAYAEGAFARANLSVKVWRHSADYKFLFIVPIRPHTLYEIPLCLDIGNKGDKSATDVEIYVKAAKPLIIRSEDLEQEGTTVKSCEMRTVNETNHTITHGFLVDSVHSAQELSFVVPIVLREPTFVAEWNNVILGDGTQLRVFSVSEVEFTLDVIVMQLHQPPSSYRFLFQIMDCADLTPYQALQRYNTERHDKELKRRAELPWWKRTTERMFRKDEMTRTVLFLPSKGKTKRLELRREGASLNVLRVGDLVAFRGGRSGSGVFVFPALKVDDVPDIPDKPDEVLEDPTKRRKKRGRA